MRSPLIGRFPPLARPAFECTAEACLSSIAREYRRDRQQRTSRPARGAAPGSLPVPRTGHNAAGAIVAVTRTTVRLGGLRVATDGLATAGASAHAAFFRPCRHPRTHPPSRRYRHAAERACAPPGRRGRACPRRPDDGTLPGIAILPVDGRHGRRRSGGRPRRRGRARATEPGLYCPAEPRSPQAPAALSGRDAGASGCPPSGSRCASTPPVRGEARHGGGKAPFH